jgi:hypothetical protein
MPHIKSKINGNVSNVRGDIAREMIKMGVAEEVQGEGVEAPLIRSNEPVPIPERKWEIRLLREMRPEPVLAIQMTQAATLIQYIGPPDLLTAKLRWDGGWKWRNGFGCEVPEGIRAEYTKRWTENQHLRGPYDPNPSVPDKANQLAAVEKATADERVLARGNVACSDREVEASLATFNKQFSEKFGGLHETH